VGKRHFFAAIKTIAKNNEMKKKILIVASFGGHWVQMRRLAYAFEELDQHYVSTNVCLADSVLPASFSVVPDANLDEKLGLAFLALKMLWVVIIIRPDFVISTGAAPGFFALVFGKLLGAKTIWIDSCANIDQLSVSGSKVKYFADLWLTQWEHLAGEEGPFFRGSVL